MTDHTAGERLFARYAFSPNELGYCGPAGAAALAAVARGETVEADLRGIASQFSGAWVYQVIVGRMLQLDPLDAEVVRGYWTGNAATARLDRPAFWERLIAVIGPRAGSYWKHLDAALASEAAPSHAFHVLGVYPWSRLLGAGRPEPLEVLTSCCIRPGVVTGVTDAGLEVSTEALAFTGGHLEWLPESLSGVAAPFDAEVPVGASVALHWGSACDVLSDTETAALREQLSEQTDRTNARLARDVAW